MADDPTATAADHEHIWRDTGFATVEDCECGATRSGDFIIEPATAVTEPKHVTTVYAVFSRYRDDYESGDNLQRIFSTEALADCYAATFSGDEEAYVTPVEVDEEPVTRVNIFSHVWSQRAAGILHSGNYPVEQQEPITMSYDSDYVPESATTEPVQVTYSASDDPQGLWIRVEGMDRDAVHAAYVAEVTKAEKRQP